MLTRIRRALKLLFDRDKTQFTVEFYKDKKKKWRWRVKSSNGKTVASSGESFQNLQDAKDITNKLFII